MDNVVKGFRLVFTNNERDSGYNKNLSGIFRKVREEKLYLGNDCFLCDNGSVKRVFCLNGIWSLCLESTNVKGLESLSAEVGLNYEPARVKVI